MTHRRHQTLSRATAEHLNAVIRACAEQIKQRNAEIEAETYARQVLAVQIEMARSE